MRDIDLIADTIVEVFSGDEAYGDFPELVYEYAAAAKAEAETMRSDKAIFRVWPRFVAAGERLVNFQPKRPAQNTVISRQREIEERRLISDARNLISYLSGARVPMPKSTHDFVERCATFRSWHDIPMAAGS